MDTRTVNASCLCRTEQHRPSVFDSRIINVLSVSGRSEGDWGGINNESMWNCAKYRYNTPCEYCSIGLCYGCNDMWMENVWVIVGCGRRRG